MTYSAQWERYLTLMEQRPKDFSNNGPLHIATDWEIVADFQQRTGITIGVCYESKYRLLVVDLVYEKEGDYFPYERILPATAPGAVVCVPRCGDRLILLKQYRHALREYQYAFPRGFAEPAIAGEDNARKELWEEMGCHAAAVEFLGATVADSGLSGEQVGIYLCSIDSWKENTDHEGIVATRSVSFVELSQMIANGEITDGYTLSAVSYLLCRKKQDIS